MNLETQIRPELWSAIRSSYELRSFTSAILDAVYYLSDLIREKSGLEADGVALVGQAFGGDRPKLRVNKMQNESERNVQRGIESILRGIYQAFRNPRSHEKYSDSESDAIALVVFINYLCTIIDESRTPFTRSDFLSRVFDPDFVHSERYAQLLAAEIPRRHRLDVFRDIWDAKETGNSSQLEVFLDSLIRLLDEVEINEICNEISDELKLTDSDQTIRFALLLLPADFWPRYDEAARIRIENKLLRDIVRGRCDTSRRCFAGRLGTFSTRIAPYFVLKDRLIGILLQKLESQEVAEQAYVLLFFLNVFPDLMSQPSQRYINAMKVGLRSGRKLFCEYLTVQAESGFLNEEQEQLWAKPFAQDIENFVENPDEEIIAGPAVTEDDIPF
jgi:uncharacterized protein (TIGR02391 family)